MEVQIMLSILCFLKAEEITGMLELRPAGLQELRKTVVWGVSPDPAEDAVARSHARDTPITTGQWPVVLFGRFDSPRKPNPMPRSQYVIFPFNKHAVQCSLCVH